MTKDPRLARWWSRVHLAALVGVMAGLAACSSGGGGGGGPFDELLFVSDTTSVSTFSVQNGTATHRDTAFIPGIPGTYSRDGDLVTVTCDRHRVPDGFWAAIDFSAGTGGTATDGQYVATFVDEDTFTVTDSASGTITNGTCLLIPVVQLAGSYVQAGVDLAVTLPNHGLEVDESVTLVFGSGTANDGEFHVTTVLDADTFGLEASDSQNTSGNVTVIVGADYAIFGMAMHPTGRWLYVTSTGGYEGGDRFYWGRDMISRFAINWDNGHLTFEESFRTAITNPTSEAAPVTLTFSADGTRLVNQDDDLDGLRLWDVNTVTGDIVQVANSDPNTTRQHGIAWSADGSRVYHGTYVFTVGVNTIEQTTLGDRGESTHILDGTMFSIIGGSSGTINTYDLTDPDAPSLIAQSDAPPHYPRDLALLDGGALIVSSGFGGLKSYTYDGGSIVPAVGAGDTEYRDDTDWPTDPNTDGLRAYRTISANAAEDVVACAWFSSSTYGGGGPPSGFSLFSVAADGSLARLADFPFSNYSRVTRFYSKPVD